MQFNSTSKLVTGLTEKYFLLFAVIICFFISSCSFGPYSGEKRYGQYHGYGTYTYPDGSKYEGTFLYGEEYGFGTLTSADGKVSKVAFRNGKRVYTEAGIKSMLRGMDYLQRNAAKNDAAIARSNRADYQAILKDRERRNNLTNFNAFRDGPNLTGGIGATDVYIKSNTSSSSSSNDDVMSSQNKKVACKMDSQFEPRAKHRAECQKNCKVTSGFYDKSCNQSCYDKAMQAFPDDGECSSEKSARKSGAKSSQQ